MHKGWIGSRDRGVPRYSDGLQLGGMLNDVGHACTLRTKYAIQAG